jgi:hypothetical protein
MDATTLDLSNHGLQQINEIYDMLTQYSQNIEILNLSGNYLKYFHII